MKLGLGFQIGRMRRLNRRKHAKMKLFAVHPDQCLPSVRPWVECGSLAWRPDGYVLQVLFLVSLSEIVEPIVLHIAIAMVQPFLGPTTMRQRPNQPMLQDVVFCARNDDPDHDITV